MKKGIKQAFEYDGGFYAVTAKCFDVLAVSLYWLLGCLPVVTIGASFSAMYTAASRTLRQDVGTVSGKFWTAYRRDLRASVPLWLIFGGAMLVVLLNIGIVMRKAEGPVGLFLFLFYCLCFLILLAAACYAFPALSRFDMPAGWIVKLSFYLAFKHLPVTLLLLALFAGSYLLLLYAPMLFLVVPGTAALLSAHLIDPLLAKHMPKEESPEEPR